MKKVQFTLLLLASLLLLTFSSCKKNSNSDTETDLTSDVTYQTDDNSRFSAEDDAVSDDINAAVETDPVFAGRGDSALAPCDASVSFDTTGLIKSMTITYNGANCAGTRTRTGTVKLSMAKNKKWKDAGTTITVDVTNLKITRLSDNKSLTLNGTKTITNVSGHLLKDLALGITASIVHTVTSSGMSATFDNGTVRRWQIAKQRTFAFNNNFVISVTGTQNIGGIDKVAIWGTNRLGTDFTTRIIEPLVINGNCSYSLVSGKVEHTGLLRPITVTFGLDASGNATGCPGAGGFYYFKAEWASVNGTVHSIIKPY